jgi:hypothetical protein
VGDGWWIPNSARTIIGLSAVTCWRFLCHFSDGFRRHIIWMCSPLLFLAHKHIGSASHSNQKWFIDVKSWRGLKLRNHQHRAGKHRCREPEVSRWATGPRACVITHLTVDTLRFQNVSECFRYVMIFVTLCCWVFSIPLDCFLWGWNMFFHQAAMSPCLANYSHGYIIYLWFFCSTD